MDKVRVAHARDAIMVFAMGGSKAPAMAGLVTILDQVYPRDDDLIESEKDPHVAFMISVMNVEKAEEKLTEVKGLMEKAREALLLKLPVLKL